MTAVGLVVIARNSAASLARIYGNPAYLAQLDALCGERIYVDSNSSDGSLQVMRDFGFTCYRLGGGGRLSAAAARHVAARYASSDLLLFLDGDMVLEAPPILPALLDTYREARARDPRLCGFTGRTCDFYAGGGTRLRTLRPDAEGCAPSFGGFVALERQALLDAGNWNPDVVANEELELHARLRGAGRRVLYMEAFGIHHYTVAASPLRELAAAYLPLRPDRYGALGMAARAAWRAGSLGWLVRLMPEPFVLLGLLAGGLPMLAEGSWLVPTLALTGFNAWVARRRGPKFIAVVPALALVLAWGLWRYREQPLEVSVDCESCLGKAAVPRVPERA